MVNEARQPLSDIIELYCRSISESQITDSVDFLPTVAAGVVTSLIQALQQASLCLLDCAAFCL